MCTIGDDLLNQTYDCIAFFLMLCTIGNQADVAAYLLHQLPDDLLAQLSFNILKATSRVGGVNSLKGVAFLLGSNFLGDPATTYIVTDTFARSGDDDDANLEQRAFLQEHWSEEKRKKKKEKKRLSLMEYYKDKNIT
ncbi:hypothetical protein ACFX1W_041115 [Malus domestica]